MPPMISPNHNHRVVKTTAGFESFDQPTDLRIDKTRAGSIGPHEVSPLSIVSDPGESWLGKIPVQIPRESRRVVAIIAIDRRKNRIVIRIEIEPLLSCVAWYMWKRVTDRQKERIIRIRFCDFVDGPRRDLKISLFGVGVRKRAPVHRRMISH